MNGLRSQTDALSESSQTSWQSAPQLNCTSSAEKADSRPRALRQRLRARHLTSARQHGGGEVRQRRRLRAPPQHRAKKRRGAGHRKTQVQACPGGPSKRSRGRPSLGHAATCGRDLSPTSSCNMANWSTFRARLGASVTIIMTCWQCSETRRRKE